MLNVNVLKEKIENYVIDLIINSDPECDWDDSFYKDKITISCCKSDNKFNVRFREQNSWTSYEFDICPFDFNFLNLFNKKERERNKELKIKHKQIRYFIDNKSNLRKLSKIVDEFPIRVQRKEKLEKLNKS